MTKNEDAKESFLKRIAGLFSDQVTPHNPAASPRVLKKLAVHKRAQKKREEALSVDAPAVEAEIQANIVWTRHEEFKELQRFLAPRSLNRRLAITGLRLRDSHANTKEVERLLEMVVENYGIAGRRAAQAVECGGVLHLILALKSGGAPDSSIAASVNEFMESIDSYSYFIRQEESPAYVVAAIQQILDRPNPPRMFLVSCSGKKAAAMVAVVADALETAYRAAWRFYRHQASGEYNSMVLMVRR